jgi:hypothetical protein
MLRRIKWVDNEPMRLTFRRCVGMGAKLQFQPQAYKKDVAKLARVWRRHPEP